MLAKRDQRCIKERGTIKRRDCQVLTEGKNSKERDIENSTRNTIKRF